MIGRGIGTRSLANNPKNIGETKGSSTRLDYFQVDHADGGCVDPRTTCRTPQDAFGKAAMETIEDCYATPGLTCCVQHLTPIRWF